jgi:hypothetical protein
MRGGAIPLVVWLAMSFSVSLARADNQCDAPDVWFGTSGTPVPLNAEPQRGDDCAFYKLAWQTFLYVTDQAEDGLRLLGYETYADVFKSDQKAAPLTAAFRQKRLQELGPQLRKTAESAAAEDIFQAGSNAVLLDQNGHAILYSIMMNPLFAAFVRSNDYTDKKKLAAAPADQELPTGVVELKAAWQIVSADNPPKDRLIVSAMVPWLIDAGNGKLKADKTRPLRAVTVALIGLHVVMRPEGHPEMIWATFEYDRNAPSAIGNPAPAVSTCRNPNKPSPNGSINDDGQPYLLFASAGVTNAKPVSIAIIDPDNQVFEATPKTSIARTFPFSHCSPALDENQAVKEINKAVAALNKSAKGKITDAARKNYSLIGAVWMDEPRNPNGNRGFREKRIFEDFELGGENRLSNTSMESFTQTGSPNCLSCHDTTGKGALEPKRLNGSHIFKKFSAEP